MPSPAFSAHLRPASRHHVLLRVPVEGTFRSPSGREGCMAGVMVLTRFLRAEGRLTAAAIFSGELCDSDGTVIGRGSRRQVVQAELSTRDGAVVATVGQVDVDLMGITVTIRPPAVLVGAGAPYRSVGRRLRGPAPRWLGGASPLLGVDHGGQP